MKALLILTLLAAPGFAKALDLTDAINTSAQELKTAQEDFKRAENEVIEKTQGRELLIGTYIYSEK